MEQLAVHPWLNNAKPHLSPTVINDQLAAALNNGDGQENVLNVCRQSAAEIEAVVRQCAQSRAIHSKFNRMVRQRRNTATGDEPILRRQQSDSCTPNSATERSYSVQSPFSVVPWGSLPASLAAGSCRDSDCGHDPIHVVSSRSGNHPSFTRMDRCRSPPPNQGREGGRSYRDSRGPAALQLPLQQTWSDHIFAGAPEHLLEDITASNSADVILTRYPPISPKKTSQLSRNPSLPQLHGVRDSADRLSRTSAHRELLMDGWRPMSARRVTSGPRLPMRPAHAVSSARGADSMSISAHHSAPSLQLNDFHRDSDWQHVTQNPALLPMLRERQDNHSQSQHVQSRLLQRLHLPTRTQFAGSSLPSAAAAPCENVRPPTIPGRKEAHSIGSLHKFAPGQ